MLLKLTCSQPKIECYKYILCKHHGSQKGKTCSKYTKDYNKGVKAHCHKKSSNYKGRQVGGKQETNDIQNS